MRQKFGKLVILFSFIYSKGDISFSFEDTHKEDAVLPEKDLDTPPKKNKSESTKEADSNQSTEVTSAMRKEIAIPIDWFAKPKKLTGINCNSTFFDIIRLFIFNYANKDIFYLILQTFLRLFTSLGAMCLQRKVINDLSLCAMGVFLDSFTTDSQDCPQPKSEYLTAPAAQVFLEACSKIWALSVDTFTLARPLWIKSIVRIFVITMTIFLSYSTTFFVSIANKLFDILFGDLLIDNFLDKVDKYFADRAYIRILNKTRRFHIGKPSSLKVEAAKDSGPLLKSIFQNNILPIFLNVLTILLRQAFLCCAEYSVWPMICFGIIGSALWVQRDQLFGVIDSAIAEYSESTTDLNILTSEVMQKALLVTQYAAQGIEHKRRQESMLENAQKFNNLQRTLEQVRNSLRRYGLVYASLHFLHKVMEYDNTKGCTDLTLKSRYVNIPLHFMLDVLSISDFISLFQKCASTNLLIDKFMRYIKYITDPDEMKDRSTLPSLKPDKGVIKVFLPMYGYFNQEEQKNRTENIKIYQILNVEGFKEMCNNAR